jgi:predicted transcriptional regulator
VNLVKNNIAKNFTVIPNELINDNELSDRARFLFCYMAAKPDNWKFFQRKTAIDLHLSMDTIRKYLQELEDSGWIDVEIGRDKGKFDACNYIMKSSPCRKKPGSVKIGIGENPNRENSALIKKESNKKVKGNKKDFEVPSIEQVEELFLTSLRIHWPAEDECQMVYKELAKDYFVRTELLNWTNNKGQPISSLAGSVNTAVSNAKKWGDIGKMVRDAKKDIKVLTKEQPSDIKYDRRVSKVEERKLDLFNTKLDEV